MIVNSTLLHASDRHYMKNVNYAAPDTAANSPLRILSTVNCVLNVVFGITKGLLLERSMKTSWTWDKWRTARKKSSVVYKESERVVLQIGASAAGLEERTDGACGESEAESV